MRTDWQTPLTIQICSSASLACQVMLSRFFSIAFRYHFAYMIISIARLGLAARKSRTGLSRAALTLQRIVVK
jgi:hypothetical protein